MLCLMGHHCCVAALLFNLCVVLGKELLLPKCVKITSINIPLDDPTRVTKNYGLHADKKKTVLSDKPEVFKVHKGLVQENGTVSLEALFHPGYFLRHKNYKFHLEKEVNNSVFHKDATFFILKVTDKPALYAFELYSHPTWFMRHLKRKPYKLVLGKVNEASKEVMDSTFYLAPHHCRAKKKKETTAQKKTILVGGGTFIDEPDEASDMTNAEANNLRAEDYDKSFQGTEATGDLGESIRIETSAGDEKSDKEPIKIHTESDVKSDDDSETGETSSDDSSEDIVKEVEEAFRISQNTNNETYLEKIEKDIQEKVNSIAAIAEGDPPNKLDGTKSDKHKDKPVDNIHIHTETDRPLDNQTNIQKGRTDKSSMIGEEERTERVEVLDPEVTKKPDKGKTFSDESELREISKDIVITGKPKLNGNVLIDTTLHYKHPQKSANRKNYSHMEKITGFNIDDVKPIKSHLNASGGQLGLKTTSYAQQNKAHQNYEEAYNVVNKNIKKLENVLRAIEDQSANNRTFQMAKKYTGRLDQTQHSNNSLIKTVLQESGTPSVKNIPAYLPPAGFKVLKSKSSAQTTVTKLPGPPNSQNSHKVPFVSTPAINITVNKPNSFQDAGSNQLAHTSGFLIKSQPASAVTAPGLHVVQGIGKQPSAAVNAQTSADVVDHIANELVDHGVASQTDSNSANRWVSKLHPHNKTLQEAFKELKPEDTKIFYFGHCKDMFPKACEEWAAQRYCLTFGQLMKRYCRKACKLCNNVIATEFTPCDKTCGGGVRLRMIKVNNRQVLQRRSCNVNNCPINGGYTPYSEWSECSVTCGDGVRYRHRSCTNPKPQFGGHDCSRFGPPVDTMPCVKGCKGFHPDKHHPSSALDADAFPEYKAEELNLKASHAVGENDSDLDNEGEEDSGSTNHAPGDIHTFQWPAKHRRKKPLVLNHVHKNVYRHKDNNGKSHYLEVDEEKDPYDQFQSHVVRYQGQQVAKMQCTPSNLLEFPKHVPNSPSTVYERSHPYKMYEGGEIMFDKDGVPTDTTKNIVQAFDSPYKIILQRSKGNKMKVLEQCIESDASVNPENDLKNDVQTYVGTTSLGEEPSHRTPVTSKMNMDGTTSNRYTDDDASVNPENDLKNDVQTDVGTTSLGEEPSHRTPVTSKMNMDGTTSNRYTDDGLYEYKYQDIGEGVEDEKSLATDVSDQLSNVMKKEAVVTQRFLRNQDPKPTLKEELAAEKEEELRENKYEEYLARKSKATIG